MKTTLFSLLTLLVLVLFIPINTPVQAQQDCTLPDLEYLGNSGTYQLGDGESFLVKRSLPYRFDYVHNNTYTPLANEEVWRVFNTVDISLTPITANSTVNLGAFNQGDSLAIAILDDNPDNKKVSILRDGLVISTLVELMYTIVFPVVDTGEYSLNTEDSIGYKTCITRLAQPTLQPLPTATVTPVVTIIPLPTPDLTRKLFAPIIINKG